MRAENRRTARPTCDGARRIEVLQLVNRSTSHAQCPHVEHRDGMRRVGVQHRRRCLCPRRKLSEKPGELTPERGSQKRRHLTSPVATSVAVAQLQRPPSLASTLSSTNTLPKATSRSELHWLSRQQPFQRSTTWPDVSQFRVMVTTASSSNIDRAARALVHRGAWLITLS